MIPATISASFAFMLPVATPPNAIVFGSQKLTVREMAREGFILNLIGIVVVTLICWLTLDSGTIE
jgi:sodium-dependent dicarboxylate transporter 2/3/5